MKTSIALIFSTLALVAMSAPTTSYKAVTNIAEKIVQRDVPSWARQQNPPTNGFIKAETDPSVPSWAKEEDPPTNGFLKAETDPSVPSWAKNPTPPVTIESDPVALPMISSLEDRTDFIEGYLGGSRVRVSVTNYYGNSSGEYPRLRIEEYVSETNTTGGTSVETNYWRVVWDENTKYVQFMTNTLSGVASMTNGLMAWCDLSKAPLAWGTVTSAGGLAPTGSVWHTEPNTVFAGGTEYAHAMVGTGVIGVLTTKGSSVYTDGETGRFHFTTDDKSFYFGMNIASRYELGCHTDGISVTEVGGNKMVELLYNIDMTGKPLLYYTPNLVKPITWELLTDSSGNPIAGASISASWDQNPPDEQEICYINCGQGVSGFFKAMIEYVGSSKFETNMMADLGGGIMATNQTSNQMQPVEPYIVNGNVMWRIKE